MFARRAEIGCLCRESRENKLFVREIKDEKWLCWEKKTDEETEGRHFFCTD